MTKKLLNQRQAWWAEFLTRFDYPKIYRPGKSIRKADALRRRPGDLPEVGDEWLKNMAQVVLKPQNLPEQLRLVADGPPTQGCPSISDHLTKAYIFNSVQWKVMEAIWMGGGL